MWHYSGRTKQGSSGAVQLGVGARGQRGCVRVEHGARTLLGKRMIRQIGLLAGAIHVCAAVEVAGYMDQYRPLPGTERYTPESLVRNFENIFDEQMLEALHKELEPLDSIAKGSGALRNSKRVTFWLGREREPRCAVERAVKLLEEVRSLGLATMRRHQANLLS